MHLLHGELRYFGFGKGEIKKPSKGKTIPLEGSYWHLPVTPFHEGLRKAKGKVNGFTERLRETMDNSYSYANGKSRGNRPCGPQIRRNG